MTSPHFSMSMYFVCWKKCIYIYAAIIFVYILHTFIIYLFNIVWSTSLPIVVFVGMGWKLMRRNEYWFLQLAGQNAMYGYQG